MSHDANRRTLRTALAGAGRILVCLTAASLLVAGAGTSTAAARQPVPVPVEQGSVGMDETLFWNGSTFPGSTIGANAAYGVTNDILGVPAETCSSPNPDTCWAYTVDVAGADAADGKAYLSLAIDANRRGDCFQVEAWAPGTYDDPEKRPASYLVQCPEVLTTMLSPQQWSMEGQVRDPADGTWTIRVIPFSLADWSPLPWAFRLRVGLEQPGEADTAVATPNLRAYPPYELSFVAPASPAAGSAIDKHNPPGAPGISCTPDELAEALEHGETPPQRCLRFSAALYNVGAGPLDLLLHPDSATGGRVTQRLRSRDGALREQRAAGAWTFHAAHQHSHYAGFVDFDLHRIVDAGGSARDPQSTKRLDPSISSHKSGWHSADQRMADWRRTDQPPANETLLDCREAGEDCITQGAGWGDHYRWQRPGNYVAFPTSPTGANVAGDYLVRMVVDRDDRVLESNERDNSAYVWLRVAGDEVTICERGLGNSPWDPHRRVHTPSFWLSGPGTTADGPSERCGE
jgi:hypothetical protein